MRNKAKAFVGAALLAASLCVCGCSGDATSGTDTETTSAATTSWDSIEVDADEIKNGTPAAHEWVDKAVEFVQENGTEDGVLIEVTGLVTEGSGKEVDTLTLVMPPEEEYDSEQDIEVEPGTPCVEVHLAEPYEMTKWTHLLGVRGMAFVDPSQENKIILVGAIETED